MNERANRYEMSILVLFLFLFCSACGGPGASSTTTQTTNPTSNPTSSDAANAIYSFASLTSGAPGGLDAIDGATLADKDAAFGVVNGVSYSFSLDADSGAAASFPSVITPASNAGRKRWIRSIPRSASEIFPDQYGINVLPGTTDMTAAVQAAVNSGIKNVSLVDSMYISAPIQLVSGTHITCRGKQFPINYNLGPGTGAAVFMGHNLTDISIENCYFNEDTASIVGKHWSSAIILDEVTGVVIKNNFFWGGAPTLFLFGIHNFEISGNEIFGPWASRLQIENASSDGIITGNTIKGGDYQAIDLEAEYEISKTAYYLAHPYPSNAAAVKTITNVKVIANNILSSGDEGISVGGADGGKFIVVAHNNVQNAGMTHEDATKYNFGYAAAEGSQTEGIRFFLAYDSVIANNAVTGGASSGIRVRGHSQRISIIENTVHNNYMKGSGASKYSLWIDNTEDFSYPAAVTMDIYIAGNILTDANPVKADIYPHEGVVYIPERVSY
jgi:hypothetical protein